MLEKAKKIKKKHSISGWINMLKKEYHMLHKPSGKEMITQPAVVLAISICASVLIALLDMSVSEAVKKIVETFV